MRLVTFAIWFATVAVSSTLLRVPMVDGRPWITYFAHLLFGYMFLVLISRGSRELVISRMRFDSSSADVTRLVSNQRFPFLLLSNPMNLRP